MEELKLTLTGKRELKSIETFYMRLYRKTFLLYGISIGIVALLLLSFVINKSEELSLLYVLIGIIVLDLCLVIVMIANAKRLAKANYQIGGDTGTVNFYETYMEIITERSTQKLLYSEAAFATEYNDMWIVFFGEKKTRVALMLSKNNYSEEQQEQMKNILIDALYGKKVKCLNK